MSEQLEGICEVCGRSRIEYRESGTIPVDEEGNLILPDELGYNPDRGVEHDPINHPSHYTDGGIETIDFIEAKKLNYNCGNATKYISRAGKKDKAERAVDIAKAIWYLQRELSTLKGKKDKAERAVDIAKAIWYLERELSTLKGK